MLPLRPPIRTGQHERWGGLTLPLLTLESFDNIADVGMGMNAGDGKMERLIARAHGRRALYDLIFSRRDPTLGYMRLSTIIRRNAQVLARQSPFVTDPFGVTEPREACNTD